MKVTIPEHNKDITLLQYQKYITLLSVKDDMDLYTFNKKKIKIFTCLSTAELNKLLQKDIEDFIALIDLALETPHEFQQTFFIDDVEFGFIPNLDKITGAEYFDLQKYGSEVETLHNLMAILFRPIVQKDKLRWFKKLFTKQKVGFDYSIVEYTGTEQMADIMKLTPMSVVNGALFFFLNLSTELLNFTQRYTAEELMRENPQTDILKSGDGMQPLTN